LARFFYRYFKVISWIFTIAFFVSMIYSAYGIYNMIIYGSCEPGSVCVVTQGGNDLLKIATCNEAHIVYGIIIVAIVALLIVRYLNIEFKIER
jgi:hypothetical protein